MYLRAAGVLGSSRILARSTIVFAYSCCRVYRADSYSLPSMALSLQKGVREPLVLSLGWYNTKISGEDSMGISLGYSLLLS